ncbi:MAG: hypothetical protein QOH37_88, partial [Nocardioidaceae bacterium]|nr:hypothetical protein [Nocardioidaceae bacterium]
YLGTVVAIVGAEHLEPARLLLRALSETCTEILTGSLDGKAVEAAQRRLGLDRALAERYVVRLRSPDEGLVSDGVVDPESLANLVALRRTYLPEPVDGRDAMDAALARDSGLVDAG